MNCCSLNKSDCKLKLVSQFTNYKKITSSRKLFSGNCELMFCKRCNFFKKKNNTTLKKNIKKIYKEYNYSKNKLISEVDQIKQFRPKKYRAEIILSHLDNKISILKYDSYLDFGCGQGAISNALLKNKIPGKKIFCFDKISILHKDIKKKINTFYTKKLHIKNKFDVIYLNHVLEHVFDPEKEINFLKTIMNENGYLIIQVPNLKFEKSLYDLFIYDHVYHFSKSSLLKFFSRFFLNLVYIDIKTIPGNIIAVFKKSNEKSKYMINNSQNIKLNNFFEKINKLLKKMENYKVIFFYGASLTTFFYCNNLKNKKIIIFDDNKNTIERINNNIKICHSSKLKDYKNITIFSSVNKKNVKNLNANNSNNRFKFL